MPKSGSTPTGRKTPNKANCLLDTTSAAPMVSQFWCVWPTRTRGRSTASSEEAEGSLYYLHVLSDLGLLIRVN